MSNIFSIRASLIDLNRGEVPTFTRSTPVYLEREVDGSLQHYPIAAHNPGFYVDDGSFLLEPSGSNLCTHNLDLTQSVWQKGGQVFLRPDFAPAPDSSYKADQVSWVTGSGASQVLRRTFLLEAGTEYVLQAILRLKGGVFSQGDVMRVVNNVDGTPQVSLSELNDSLGAYKKLQLKFKVAGRQPEQPGTPHEVATYDVAQVNTNNLVLVVPSGFNVDANQFEGGQLVIEGGNVYQISGNTVLASGQVTVFTQEATLVSDGVTSGDKVSITNPQGVPVDIEFYVESTAAVDWGGLDLKQGAFFTSVIYQDNAIESRSETLLSWRHSPFADLKTLGFYGDIRYWEGDGPLFNAGNFSGAIVGGNLQINAGGTTLTTANPLPPTFRFFIQIQETTGVMNLYVNGTLISSGAVSNFRADSEVPFVLSSDAVRAWRTLMVRELPTLEGQPVLGGAAQEEVAELFSAVEPINSADIASHQTALSLPTVEVPAKSAPNARVQIDGITFVGGNTQLNVGNANGFLANTTIAVMRGIRKIADVFIISTTAGTITVAGQPSIVIGDILEYRQVQSLGTASVRFPSDPIAPFEIQAIDAATRRITINSALSFKKARAFVRTAEYQDVAEVLVESVDTIGTSIVVDSIENIAVGMVIFQPLNELYVEPANYSPGIVEDVEGISVGESWRNGIVLYNSNPFPVTVRPYLRVYL